MLPAELELKHCGTSPVCSFAKTESTSAPAVSQQHTSDLSEALTSAQASVHAWSASAQPPFMEGKQLLWCGSQAF